MSHLQLQQDSSEHLDEMELADQIIEGCAGPPLALAVAAGCAK
jgi:hypothetical protein